MSASKKDEFVPPAAAKPCPCGTGKTFAACCQPILAKQKPAEDAEQLMRSRFSAHVAHDYEHLHRSYLKTSAEPYVPDANEGGGREWTRLVIHSHDRSNKPETAFVDFTAYYQENGAEQAFHEKAEFQRVDGTWFYTKAVRQGPPPIKSEAKVGRNDPCPCGSGKKYKQCCLKKA